MEEPKSLPSAKPREDFDRLDCKLGLRGQNIITTLRTQESDREGDRPVFPNGYFIQRESWLLHLPLRATAHSISDRLTTSFMPSIEMALKSGVSLPATSFGLRRQSQKMEPSISVRKTIAFTPLTLMVRRSGLSRREGQSLRHRLLVEMERFTLVRGTTVFTH